MKNILFIHDYPLQEGGGIEIQTYQDATEFASRGFEVCILSSRCSSETYIDKKNMYPYKTEQGVELDCVTSLEAMKKRIMNADIVHIQATFSMRPAMMSAMRICVAFKRKYIVTLHTNASHIPFSALASMSAFEKDILLEEFRSLISHNLCTIVGVSESIRQSLTLLGISKDFEVVFNAKDWKKFAGLEVGVGIAGARTAASDVFIPKVDSVDVTYIGEVSWMKGMHVFIGALSMLVKDMPDVSIRVIGAGQDKKCVEALVQSLNLSSNVTFIPYVENKNLPAYIGSTAILVQPSLSETWGNIVMEALVCGATPVVSNTEGLPELVENGKLGDVFERGNVYDLYKKISFRLNNPISSLKKKKISTYIQKKYSMNGRVGDLLLVYRKNQLKRLKSADTKGLIEFCAKID